MTVLEPDELRSLLDAAAAGPTTGDFDDVYRRARRQHERRRLSAVGAVMVVVAVAIVVPSVLLRGGNHAESVGRQDNVSMFQPGNPRALLGSWTVQASGEAARTPVQFDAEVTVERACGEVGGSWLADPAGLFSGYIDTGSRPCLESSQGFSVPWLTSAVAYRQQGQQIELVDASGDTVATLTPAPATPGEAPSPRFLKSLQAPAPLPAGVTPATATELVGRWKAVGVPKESPAAYGEFRGATWFATDGCNDDGGRYVVGPGGDLLTTSGGSTDVFCGLGVESAWITDARRAGFVNGRLALFSVSGRRIGALRSQQTGMVTGTLQSVGGPAPGSRPVSGTITFRLPGRQEPQVVHVHASNGAFHATVPVGRYRVLGFSPHIRVDGQPEQCAAPGLTTVSAGQTSTATVSCQIR